MAGKTALEAFGEGGGIVMARQMYCVKCREKRGGKNHEQVTMKNGKKAVKAVCEVCGTGMFLIGADVSEF